MFAPAPLPAHAELDIGGQRIRYRIRVSARRRLAVEINGQGEVILAAPSGCPYSIVHAFACQHADWIARHWRAAATAGERAPAPLADGTRLPWLGEWLTLRLRTDTARVDLERARGLLLAPATEPAHLRLALERWYRRAAHAVASARLAHFAVRVGRAPTALHIRGQRTRWGSCSARGVISLNWRLTQAPAGFLDYVVVHELCHLRERNHSARFWQAVEAVLPDYRRWRAGLRDIHRGFVL